MIAVFVGTLDERTRVFLIVQFDPGTWLSNDDAYRSKHSPVSFGGWTPLGKARCRGCMLVGGRAERGKDGTNPQAGRVVVRTGRLTENWSRTRW